MNVFVAGASGVVGKSLVPQLIKKGYSVVAMTRSEQKARELRTLGVQAVVADGLDGAAVMKAVTSTKPDVIVHQMTSLTDVKDFKNFDREFAVTNRLRTEGTDNLVAAARAAGVGRIVAQSYGNWTYDRTGTALKTEDDALDPHPPANQRKSLEAIRYLEDRITRSSDFDGIALRFANFYGPGTSFAPDGIVANMVRKRMLPIIGNGGGVWAFVHVDDVATATVCAIEHGAPGVYNIVDNEPAPAARWIPELAVMLGAKAPMHVPVWLGRLAIGDVGVSMMTQIRGTSNAKAISKLGWSPRYNSWRAAFRNVVGTNAAAGAA